MNVFGRLLVYSWPFLALGDFWWKVDYFIDIFDQNLATFYSNLLVWGAWIAEWSSHLTNEHWYAAACPGPWGQSLVRTIFFGSSITSMLNFQRKRIKGSRKKQLLVLSFVKKFVLFTKVCWKSRKWRIKIFLKKILKPTGHTGLSFGAQLGNPIAFHSRMLSPKHKLPIGQFGLFHR